MGLTVSNTSPTAVANRLITKSATAGQTTLSATVATGTSTTAGSYVQATASSAAEYLLTGIVVRQNNSSTATGSALDTVDFPIFVDVSTGAPASETVMATVPIVGTMTSQLVGFMNLAIPLRIPASTRIAVRAKKNAGNVASTVADIVVVLLLTPYANVEGN